MAHEYTISLPDFTSDSWVKYAVFFFFIALAVLAVSFIFKQHVGFVEGLANNGRKPGSSPLDDTTDNDIVTIAQKQKETAEQAHNSLHVDTHYEHYNEIINNMDEWVNAKIVNSLKNVSHQIQNEGKIEDIIKHMDELNTMKKFRMTLDDCAKYIDTH
jgi:hypothetical protein